MVEESRIWQCRRSVSSERRHGELQLSQSLSLKENSAVHPLDSGVLHRENPGLIICMSSIEKTIEHSKLRTLDIAARSRVIDNAARMSLFVPSKAFFLLNLLSHYKRGE